MTNAINVTVTDLDEQAKAEALAAYLECEVEEAANMIEDGDWRVMTDDEADEAVKESILDSAWAFRPSFLASHSAVADEGVFVAIAANNKDEDNSPVVLKLLRDVDAFVSDAVSIDGRGHFLSGYDGEEVELNGGLFAYRCN